MYTTKLNILMLALDYYYYMVITLVCADTSTVQALVFEVIICVSFTDNSRSLLNTSKASWNSIPALSLTPRLGDSLPICRFRTGTEWDFVGPRV